MSRYVNLRDRAERPTAVRAVVSKAPADAGDPIAVVLINYSRTLEYTIPRGQWSERTTLPEVGDSCLVVFDDDGDAWVPVWIPTV